VKTTYPDVDPLLWTPKEGHPKKKRRNATGEPNAPEAILKKRLYNINFVVSQVTIVLDVARKKLY
jgi:hypothetical protein